MCKDHNIKAIIFDKKGRVLSIGHNDYNKSHPVMAALSAKHNEPYKIYPHAEVMAILKCKDLTKAYKILVTRVNNKGDLLLAKPCAICQGAIKAAGITLIEHS